jgi:hypothetical protein
LDNNISDKILEYSTGMEKLDTLYINFFQETNLNEVTPAVQFIQQNQLKFPLKPSLNIIFTNFGYLEVEFNPNDVFGYKNDNTLPPKYLSASTLIYCAVRKPRSIDMDVLVDFDAIVGLDSSQLKKFSSSDTRTYEWERAKMENFLENLLNLKKLISLWELTFHLLGPPWKY